GMGGPRRAREGCSAGMPLTFVIELSRTIEEFRFGCWTMILTPGPIRRSQSMNTDRRLMPRYTIALPITAGSLRGTTRNLGVTGVSFVAPSSLSLEENIAFSITLAPEPNMLSMNCRGVVKRAARMKDGQFEIVATIEAMELDTAPRS